LRHAGYIGKNEAMEDRPTVFVVDDDPAALQSLSWLLSQANLQVRSFSTGREFLDSYQPGEPGCLVCDVRMPEMDGLTLQQILRQREIRVPIIFVTAFGDLTTCARAFRGGAADFLRKPVNETVLLERVKSLIAEEDQRRGKIGCA